jgi:putative lipoprotein (rSAM/lipoprotein system)
MQVFLSLWRFGQKTKKIMAMKLTGKLIAKLLMLCGISLTCTACYAPGHADFEIKGRVMDDGNPIAGIRVTAKPSDDSENTISTATTNAHGIYQISIIPRFFDVGSTVTVEDIDGEANGGDFQSQTKILTEEDLAAGIGSKFIDFELEPKTVNPE